MPTFLLELGTEELPADFVTNAIEQWKELIPKSLKAEQLLTKEAVEIYGTPRRLAVLIKGLPLKQASREEEIKGPPAQTAFKDGKPTPAAEGFAKKQGVEVEDLSIRNTDKGEFVFILKKTPGLMVEEILQELAPKWISQLKGKRFMRWADGDLRFPRPIRTIVALLDDRILPIELVNGSCSIKSDRHSSGHRVLHREQITINHASDYVEALKAGYIQVDQEARKNQITQQIQQLAEQIQATAEIPSDLLEEVTNLVEWPTAVVGNFDPEFLSLPAEVIITVMVTHQRYFALKAKADKKLMAQFITIANGSPAFSDIIATGNAKVIRARLADAQFFYKADCDEHLESYLTELETVTFQKDLGTMRDKVDRLMEITQQIMDQLELKPQQRKEIESTALLCKADLVTQMVYEFPELQGVMGQKYALVSGESEAVATGIFEHYLPRGADDLMPETLPGQIVGIADRLDTLVSIFGLGMLPTGSSDPFALRRAANAVINVTWYGNLPINLLELLKIASEDFVTAHSQESPLKLLQEFFISRLRTLLLDDLKVDYDLVNAVLGENDLEYSQRALENLLDLRDRALFLQQIRNNGVLNTIYETVNRSTRLAAQGDLDTQQLEPQTVVNTELFQKSSEEAFYQALSQLVPQTLAASANSDYQLLVDGLAKIAPIVSNFFDGADSVLVMDENKEIRKNRLNLLGLLRNHARVLADFGSIVKVN